VSELRVTTHSPAETRAVGCALGKLLEAGDLVLLAGDLGAGKTQLAKGIADGLDVRTAVVSPTFTLARRYDGAIPLVHVDLYRLDRVQELIDLALEEELDEVVTVVEWGDVAGAHLPGERLEIRLERLGGDDDRQISFAAEGPSWRARLAAIRSALGQSA
jgi:tRNA threonylcarbamoyladenosine biosynthesis protein TsaE